LRVCAMSCFLPVRNVVSSHVIFIYNVRIRSILVNDLGDIMLALTRHNGFSFAIM
ncbi:hypothetical protein MTO96_045254, partial [Rhipicephalus appendiculatus]